MISDDIDAFPLQWPVGWRREGCKLRARFGARGDKGFRALTIGEGRDQLLAELERLGTHSVVISSNAPLRLNGKLRADASNPKDPGAAAYFRFDAKPHVLACDRWDRLADNLAAIAKHIEAMRGQDRWGVGSLAQAFAGYRALTAVGERKQWWQILGFKNKPSIAEAERKWESLIRLHHPDRGGNPNQAAEINAAIQEARDGAAL